jgi:hypothetical protein
MTAFEHLKEFCDRLKLIETSLAKRNCNVLRAKAFYFWINKFHSRKDQFCSIHAQKNKQKVFRHFDILRRQAKLKCVKVNGYYHKKLKLKAFFGILKFMDARRRKKEESRVETPNDETHLGLVKVVPIVDKKIDQAYGLGPLMNSMMSLPDIIKDREDIHHDFTNDYAKSHEDFG